MCSEHRAHRTRPRVISQQGRREVERLGLSGMVAGWHGAVQPSLPEGPRGSWVHHLLMGSEVELNWRDWQGMCHPLSGHRRAKETTDAA